MISCLASSVASASPGVVSASIMTRPGSETREGVGGQFVRVVIDTLMEELVAALVAPEDDSVERSGFQALLDREPELIVLVVGDVADELDRLVELLPAPLRPARDAG